MQQYDKHIQGLIEKHVRDAAILAGTVEGRAKQLPPTCSIAACVNDLYGGGVTSPEIKRLASAMRWQSDKIAEETGKTARGLFVPWSVFARDLKPGVPSAGGALTTEIHADDVSAALRARSVALAAGAVLLTDVSGAQIVIPGFDDSVPVSWVDVGTSDPTADPDDYTDTKDEVSKGDPSFKKVVLKPHTLAARIDVSLELLRNGATNPGFETVLRREIVAAMMAELDRVIFNGAGTDTEPEGILISSAVETVALGATGGAPTWELLADLEDAVASKNADDSGVFVTNSAVRKKLRKTQRAAGLDYVWTSDTLLGKPAFVTENIPSDLTKGATEDLSAMVYGDFSNVFVALWGASMPDIVLNPYSARRFGTVQVTAFLDVGIGIRHGAGFAVCKDIVTI